MDSTSLGLLVRRERKSHFLWYGDLPELRAVPTRRTADLEAGKPTLQLGKALQVIATLGCDVQIVSPASRRS